MRNTRLWLMALWLLWMLALAPALRADACGGFFCTNVPVDQAAERIIFAVNDDAGTIDAYVQINYQGAPDAFAWVVPVPNPPKVDVADIKLIQELDRLTRPVYIPPPFEYNCAFIPFAFGGPAATAPAMPSNQSVTLFAQSSVGPFDYAVVGSSDSQAMVKWLRDNQYQITPAMEPLVDVYVKEQMVFLAMKLQPKKEVKDIQPVKMTYKSTKPMIPLRLTAVAATPDMAVITWILAKTQAEPENYAVMTIPNDQIVFTNSFYRFSGRPDNYQQLISQTADRLGGRAFITEYAGAAAKLNSTDAGLMALLRSYPYLTRVYTLISPQEMTVDPVFRFNGKLPELSNIHDLSRDMRRWDCDGTNRTTNPIELALATLTNNFNPCFACCYLFIGVGLLIFFISKERRKSA